MAARKVNTPGAPEKAPEPVSTAEQADAALEHITGQGAESQDQSTNETSSVSEPVEPTAEELAAKKEYEEFLAWRKSKGEAAQPPTQHAPTSNASIDPTAKRTRQVVGPNGWITEEY